MAFVNALSESSKVAGLRRSDRNLEDDGEECRKLIGLAAPSAGVCLSKQIASPWLGHLEALDPLPKEYPSSSLDEWLCQESSRRKHQRRNVQAL